MSHICLYTKGFIQFIYINLSALCLLCRNCSTVIGFRMLHDITYHVMLISKIIDKNIGFNEGLMI